VSGPRLFPACAPLGADFIAICRCTAIVLAMLFTHAPGGATAQGRSTEQRSKVEAAFLRNFARYVTWPPAAFANERSPWVVCILGQDHFDDTLDKTLQGRTEQGRAFEVVRLRVADRVTACHIVYIGYDGSTKRRAVLNELRSKPVLTVGDAPEFLDEGGIIRLLAGERIEMSINLDQARAVSLAIPSKMLEVSRDVLENGSMRKLR
jgi:hypothetical protein